MNKGVTWFLILAFAGAWIPWGIAIRAGIPVGSVQFQFAALPGAFAPAIAAIVVRKWITREGFGDAGLELNLRKWRYYLIGLFLPFIVMGFVVLEAMVFSVATPDFSMHAALKTLGAHSANVPANPWARWAVISTLLTFEAIVSTPIFWGEEFGWRGYLQVRLFTGRPLLAAVATGLIWAAWHYPLILRGYDYPGHPFDGVAVFTVGVVFMSIIFGWLRNATRSVWSTSLAHAATNSIGGGLSVFLFGREDAVVAGYLGFLALVPLGFLCVWIVWTGRLAGPVIATTSHSVESLT